MKITTKASKPAIDKDPKEIIEKLKAKQNDEMLKVLEEEREKEKQRETELENIQEENTRKHMEQTFKVERGLACARIERLAE